MSLLRPILLILFGSTLLGILIYLQSQGLLSRFFQRIRERRGKENEEETNYCRDVHSLRDFISSNGSLFSIIGLSGAVIGLIPGFTSALIGPSWKYMLVLTPFGIVSLILIQAMIISNALLILYISSIIIRDLFSCRWNNKTVHSIGRYQITKGDLERGFFLIFFVPTIGALVYFIVPIFSFSDDAFFIKMNLALISLFFWIALCYWIFTQIVQELWAKKTKDILLAILLIVAIICPLVGFQTHVIPEMAPFTPHTGDSESEIRLIPDSETYDLTSSDQLGLKITIEKSPPQTSSLERQYLSYHWSASYGHFVVLDRHNHRVSQSGSEIALPESDLEIFWTWSPSDSGKIKPPVTLFLSIENKLTKKRYGGDQLTLIWEDTNTVRVKRERISLH